LRQSKEATATPEETSGGDSQSSSSSSSVETAAYPASAVTTLISPGGPGSRRRRRSKAGPVKTASAASGGKASPSLSMVTRSSRRVKLINPFAYHNCLLCKAGYYREKHLRHHYKARHSLDFGDARLPKDDLAIQCQQIDRQSSNFCNICSTRFADLEEVMVHKTNCHVPSYFKAHQCTHCQMRFTLSRELRDHLMVHDL